MTTEVIIKNQSGLVMAADSAVTISNMFTDGKVYNSANKLFSLSKYDPIGILIYNSVNINEIPVEIIIKEYRETLKPHQYDTLEEYFDGFKNFVQDFVNEHHKSYDLLQIFNIFLNALDQAISKAHTESQQPIDQFDVIEFINKTTDDYQKSCTQSDFRDGDDLIKKSDIMNFLKQPNSIDTFNNHKNSSYYFAGIPDIQAIEQLFTYYTRYNIIQSYTGIAIAGYGNKDIFPKICKINIHGNIGTQLITSRENIISDEASTIIPLAQRQMIDTFVRGVSDDILTNVNQLFESNIDALISLITDQLKDTCDKILLIAAIKAKLRENIKNINDAIDMNYTQKTLISLSNLSKEEMAELAETLINLQALKYKVSPDLETVGGPVDVAIISKNDGFVWKKRKLYFPPELNFHFFENYFKK